MNRAVAKMGEEALRYNRAESVLKAGATEELFTTESFARLTDVEMPATKLELLVKMIRREIREYGKTNRIAAKHFRDMPAKTIEVYHERRQQVSAEEAGETQAQATADIMKSAMAQALSVLRELNESRESFRKVGMTFEEKAFYDILIALRDSHGFVYGKDKTVGGVVVNERCRALARKVKEILDVQSAVSNWLINKNVRADLEMRIKLCLIKNGYPPQYSQEVFNNVMLQAENFAAHHVQDVAHAAPGVTGGAMTARAAYVFESVPLGLVAEKPA